MKKNVFEIKNVFKNKNLEKGSFLMPTILLVLEAGLVSPAELASAEGKLKPDIALLRPTY